MIDIKSNITKFVKEKIFYGIRKYKEIFPKIISIEFTSACNAKCIMCPQPDMDRKKENMSLEVLNKIISDCKNKPLKKINSIELVTDRNVVKSFFQKIKYKRYIDNIINKLKSLIK